MILHHIGVNQRLFSIIILTRLILFWEMFSCILTHVPESYKRITDPMVILGDEVTLTCVSAKSRSVQPQYCSWLSPDKTLYEATISGFKPDEHESLKFKNPKVIIDGKFCLLKITHVTQKDNGPWQCIIDYEDPIYSLLRIENSSNNDKFRILLDPDDHRITARRGQNVTIKCPSNTMVIKNNIKPMCTWFDPHGKKYSIIDRHGGIYGYPHDGIEYGGVITRGDCAITVHNVEYRHSGQWRCQLLQPSKRSTSSEIVSANIQLNVFRTSRLLNNPTLQGYQESTEDVTIYMKVPINPDYRFTEIYWIVQRKYVVAEDSEKCPKHSSQNCFSASKRKKLPRTSGSGRNSNTHYKLSLTFDFLTKDDVDSPLFLIMDYRDAFGKDRYKIYKVSQEALDKDERDLFEAGDKKNDSKGRQGGCRIDGRLIRVGRSRKYSKYCIEIYCQRNNNIEVNELRRNCRRRSSTRDRNNNNYDDEYYDEYDEVDEDVENENRKRYRRRNN